METDPRFSLLDKQGRRSFFFRREADTKRCGFLNRGCDCWPGGWGPGGGQLNAAQQGEGNVRVGASEKPLSFMPVEKRPSPGLSRR